MTVPHARFCDCSQCACLNILTVCAVGDYISTVMSSYASHRLPQITAAAA